MRTLHLALTAALGLVACGGQDPATGGGAGASTDDDSTDWEPDDRDDPYIDPDPGDQDAAFDADAVAQVIEDALWTAREVHGQPVIDAYAEVLADIDPDCPAWGNQDGLLYWQDSCTAESGTAFEGYGYVTDYTDYADGDIIWNGLGVSAVATVLRPDGAAFTGAGSALQLVGLNSAGADVYYSYVDEGFTYDGPAAAGTWLLDGVSPALQAYGFHYPSGGKLLYVTGRVQVDEGPVRAVVFDNLLLLDEQLGPCPTEPSGGLSVLGEDGWYDLTFDGPTFDEAEGFDASLCDGCGTAWHKGQRIGEACVNFSVMTSWETHPWE